MITRWLKWAEQDLLAFAIAHRNILESERNLPQGRKSSPLSQCEPP